MRNKKSFNIQVYQAKSHKDRQLLNTYNFPDWLIPIQVGSDLTQEQAAQIRDNTGDNISGKNANYCELTALYWIWKNVLISPSSDYYGLFHYRRILDIQDEDLCKLYSNNIDVILPFPTIHEPNIKEHHSRYVSEADWHAMLQALCELSPEYYDAYEIIFSQEYMYNYNILIAKTDILRAYCEWLFPILSRTEELSVPKGGERADRYIGYLGENLLTLYFMYNKDKLNIVHTGRIMLL